MLAVITAAALVVAMATGWFSMNIFRRMKVTAQKSRQATEALHAREASTQAILDAAVDGIITIDEHGIVQGVNKAAERIFGYTAAEMTGRNVSGLMPEPYRSAHDGYLHNYLSTGHAKIIGIGRTVLGLRRDGTTFPMDLAVGESRLEDGQRIFAGIVRDVTERKHTEERLRHSEERFRLLVEGARDYSITMLDNQGRIASWNAGGERFTGWAAEDIIGRHHSIFFTPEALSQGEPARVLSIVDSQGRYESELWNARKDSTRFWAHVTVTPQRDASGELLGYVRIAR
ncbi:MAG: PAS domain S-box protein, partial [Rhodospirillales bacterium]|nr:PAS domain S-box protein [Rhodospirillales bacterium]